jgi:hypothetical protein
MKKRSSKRIAELLALADIQLSFGEEVRHSVHDANAVSAGDVEDDLAMAITSLHLSQILL